MSQTIRKVGFSDDELVPLAQSGDHRAFAELMHRHYPTCLKLALSILRDRQDAEDEVQNACWKAYEHIRQFQQDAKYSTWLSRIVVNQCLMRLRKNKRVKLFYLEEGTLGDEAAAFELPDVRKTPEQALGEVEVGDVLSQEIRRLPPLLRNVFMLREIEQRPMPEVAERLGISTAAAKSRLLRARNELRNRMSRHLGRLGAGTLTN